MSNLAWRWAVRTLVLSAITAAILLASSPAKATPGFARQAGLACEACHTVFPELTPFGRLFKLNGYVFSNIPELRDINANREPTMVLSALAPLSLQLQASYTSLADGLPDPAGGTSQKNDFQFPQALSLFYTGKIADNLGAFLQLTWVPDTNSVGIDNSELRFADHGDISALNTRDFIYGITLNNNPTVQDVWNTTPAWTYPFIATNVGVGSIAATEIDGTLAQQAAGLGGYLYLYNHLYLELSGYLSAPTGFTNTVTGNPGPLNSDTTRLSNVAPYWRVAWEQDWERNSLMFGTYGLYASLLPTGVPQGGSTVTITDAALDAQYQYIGESNIFSLYATWIQQWQNQNVSSGAFAGANPHDTLATAKLTGSYFYNRRLGGSLQFFSTTGSSDSVLYAPASVTGSANGSPITQGATIELDYLPWLNTKLGIQYTAYSRFNGAKNNYDGFGRNASSNDTAFLFLWVAF